MKFRKRYNNQENILKRSTNLQNNNENGWSVSQENPLVPPSYHKQNNQGPQKSFPPQNSNTCRTSIENINPNPGGELNFTPLECKAGSNQSNPILGSFCSDFHQWNDPLMIEFFGGEQNDIIYMGGNYDETCVEDDGDRLGACCQDNGACSAWDESTQGPCPGQFHPGADCADGPCEYNFDGGKCWIFGSHVGYLDGKNSDDQWSGQNEYDSYYHGYYGVKGPRDAYYLNEDNAFRNTLVNYESLWYGWKDPQGNGDPSDGTEVPYAPHREYWGARKLIANGHEYPCWDSDMGATKELCERYFNYTNGDLTAVGIWVSDDDFIEMRKSHLSRFMPESEAEQRAFLDLTGHTTAEIPKYPNQPQTKEEMQIYKFHGLPPGNRCFDQTRFAPGGESNMSPTDFGNKLQKMQMFLESGIPEDLVTIPLYQQEYYGATNLEELWDHCLDSIPDDLEARASKNLWMFGMRNTVLPEDWPSTGSPPDPHGGLPDEDENPYEGFNVQSYLWWRNRTPECTRWANFIGNKTIYSGIDFRDVTNYATESSHPDDYYEIGHNTWHSPTKLCCVQEDGWGIGCLECASDVSLGCQNCEVVDPDPCCDWLDRNCFEGDGEDGGSTFKWNGMKTMVANTLHTLAHWGHFPWKCRYGAWCPDCSHGLNARSSPQWRDLAISFTRHTGIDDANDLDSVPARRGSLINLGAGYSNEWTAFTSNHGYPGMGGAVGVAKRIIGELMQQYHWASDMYQSLADTFDPMYSNAWRIFERELEERTCNYFHNYVSPLHPDNICLSKCNAVIWAQTDEGDWESNQDGKPLIGSLVTNFADQIYWDRARRWLNLAAAACADFGGIGGGFGSNEDNVWTTHEQLVGNIVNCIKNGGGWSKGSSYANTCASAQHHIQYVMCGGDNGLGPAWQFGCGGGLGSEENMRYMMPYSGGIKAGNFYSDSIEWDEVWGYPYGGKPFTDRELPRFADEDGEGTSTLRQGSCYLADDRCIATTEWMCNNHLKRTVGLGDGWKAIGTIYTEGGTVWDYDIGARPDACNPEWWAEP